LISLVRDPFALVGDALMLAGDLVASLPRCPPDLLARRVGLIRGCVQTLIILRSCCYARVI